LYIFSDIANYEEEDDGRIGKDKIGWDGMVYSFEIMYSQLLQAQPSPHISPHISYVLAPLDRSG
jgi:hypothetical protein